MMDDVSRRCIKRRQHADYVEWRHDVNFIHSANRYTALLRHDETYA